MKWIKKITSIILIAVLALGFSVGSLTLTPPQQTHALGLVGANAVKSVVIGSMERAGVKFGSKEAKEKAFEAWNMKAYDKWKADEAAGRNADLWATWHAFEQNPASAMQPAPDAPDKPGVGKFLLNATIFGMAIGIGAEIGYGIEDARLQNNAMQYLTSDYRNIPSGSNLNGIYGYTVTSYAVNSGGYKHRTEFTSPTGEVVLRPGSILAGETMPIYITGVREYTSSGKAYYEFTYTYHERSPYDGGQMTSGERTTIIQKSLAPIQDTGGGYKYEAVPKPDHVPQIAPVPELAPLIAPSPDLATIPEVLPPAVPVEVIIPEAPDSDPFWDGEINDPYVPPTPGDNEEPDKPPGTDPDGDPDKPPGTDPDGDPDAPPGTDPDGDTDAPPGTDPGKDEETPPGEDGEQPPKEDEENSCDASLKKPDFKKVGVAFTNAFPFSLPWDLKRFFDAAFSGIGSEKPSVDLTFLGDGVTVTIPDYFDSWIAVLKNIMVIMFDISLIWMFARFMQRGGGD